MEKTYNITGMTCMGCVNNVKSALEKLEGVEEAQIQLEFPQGKLSMHTAVPTEKLQQAIGHYGIEEVKSEPAPQPSVVSAEDIPDASVSTYKPLILIVSFIAGVSLLAQYPFSEFSGMLWMRHFMAGFFIVFSFFKLLNLEGFAMSYRMYDIVAERWKGWGYIYPFVELGLGILYLTNLIPFWTNVMTVVVLGISSIGVIKSNLDKRKIKCACLGDVFNLPMSTVTIVEDVSMVAMAGLMLWWM